MKKLKLKPTIILIVLLVMAITVGIVLAILSSKTEQRANNFTFGDVTIDLTEEGWTSVPPEDKVLYPERSVTKDPKVTNTGRNEAYIYIEVKVPRAEVKTVNANETVNAAAMHTLFTYTVNPGWTQIGSDTISADEEYTVRLYAYTAKIVKPGEETGTLFDKVTLINILEGEIEMGTEIDMPISAIAIQAYYLNEEGSTMLEKMTDAYNKYQTQKEYEED